ncbi:MAG: hypothetical protein AAFQ82_24315 [Myxococcota bacterium]
MATVANSSGWRLEAAPQGGPVNLGAGGGGEVRMAHAILLTQNRSGLSGKHGGQTSVLLRADGRAEVR